MNGISFTPEQKERFVSELQQHDVTLNGNGSEKVCDKEKFAQGFHQFLQTIFWINALENQLKITAVDDARSPFLYREG